MVSKRLAAAAKEAEKDKTRLTSPPPCLEREFFIDDLLVRDHFIIVMIRWIGVVPWEFEFLFPGSLTSTFLASPIEVFLGSEIKAEVFRLKLSTAARGKVFRSRGLERESPVLTTYWSESTVSS